LGFRDHFSRQAVAYARYRPRYPPALFTYLASVSPAGERAWDCATGAGQAALGLPPHFDTVIATDASEAQLAQATHHAKIAYCAASAEHPPLRTGSVDLLTIAQALHWLDLGGFYREAIRVVRPGGVLAAWCYGLLRVSPPVDTVLAELYANTLAPYWPTQRRLVDEAYQTLAFPFSRLRAPAFRMEANWRLEHLLGYLGTWSAVQRYRDERGADPVQAVAADLSRYWGCTGQTRQVVWPIHLLVGHPDRPLTKHLV